MGGVVALCAGLVVVWFANSGKAAEIWQLIKGGAQTATGSTTPAAGSAASGGGWGPSAPYFGPSQDGYSATSNTVLPGISGFGVGGVGGNTITATYQ